MGFVLLYLAFQFGLVPAILLLIENTLLGLFNTSIARLCANTLSAKLACTGRASEINLCPPRRTFRLASLHPTQANDTFFRVRKSGSLLGGGGGGGGGGRDALLLMER